MEELFAQLFGGTSDEATYLQMIAFLDQAESISNRDCVPTELNVTIAKAKQHAIDAFAECNRNGTLTTIMEKAGQTG